MNSILSFLVKHLAPLVKGLPVLPFAEDCRTYLMTHPIGGVLLKLEGGRLTVELPFKVSHIHCAGDYLELVREALSKAVPLGDKSEISFEFEKNHFLSYDPATDTNYHAATFLVNGGTVNPEPAPEVAE